jgi:hypothetical protein
VQAFGGHQWPGKEPATPDDRNGPGKTETGTYVPRHRRKYVLNVEGSCGGQALHSGSRSMTRASTWEMSSPGNGGASGQQLVQHRTKRPDVVPTLEGLESLGRAASYVSGLPYNGAITSIF